MADMDGRVSFVEMGSGEPEKTRAFFAALFGWTFHARGEDGGWFETANGTFGLHGGDPGWGMVPYLGVSDIHAAAQRVRELGGDAEGIVTEEGFGRFCNCRDPQGMRFGLHQPAEAAETDEGRPSPE